MAKTGQEQRRAKQAKSRIPTFKTIEEEAEFWDTHSTTEFEDEFEEIADVRFVVTRAQPKKAITVRLGQDTLAALTRQAHELGIGPSTLARMWVLERLRDTADRSSTGVAARTAGMLKGDEPMLTSQEEKTAAEEAMAEEAVRRGG